MTVLTDELRVQIRRMLTTPPNRKAKRKGPSKTGSIWPFASDALGVNPEQIEEAREHYRTAGVPTEYTKDGRAILTGPRHYHKHAKASGLFTGRDGYGAPSSDGG